MAKLGELVLNVSPYILQQRYLAIDPSNFALQERPPFIRRECCPALMLTCVMEAAPARHGLPGAQAAAPDGAILWRQASAAGDTPENRADLSRGCPLLCRVIAPRASRTTRGVDSSGNTGVLHRAPDGRSGWPHAHLRTKLPTTLLAAELVTQLDTISGRCSAEVLF